MIAQTNTSISTTRLIPAADEPLRRVSAETEIDREFVARCLGGDESAFAAIVERYRDKIFSVTNGLLRNRADAEEITQDTFIRAHRGLANFRGDSSLSTWLYRIAINLARNRYWYFFRRHRQDAISLDCALGEGNTATFSDLVADCGQNPAEATVTAEFARLVLECMGRLEKPHREILEMRNHLHNSYDEIAVKLRINVGTVKSRIARARESLREKIAENFPELAPDVDPKEWFLSSRATYGRPAIACA